jgi:hypothetical protein
MDASHRSYTTDEVLTVEEMKARFDSEWVLVEDPQLGESMEVLAGKVLWHSKDRDEMYQKAVELRPKHWASLYLGKIPEDMVIIL